MQEKAPKQRPMDKLHGKNISPSSFELYKKNLLRLNDGKEIRTVNFLKEPEKVLEKIAHYKPNTRRTYIISIVSLLKEEPKLKKLYDRYYSILVTYNKELKVNNEKSDAQKVNWLTTEQIKTVYEDLEKSVEPLFQRKKITESEYDRIQSFVILSLYILSPPRRNMDYQLMKIVPKYTDEFDKRFNYLVIGDGENAEFVFNNYKTQRTYKTQRIAVPIELFAVIKSYLLYHPLKKELKKKKYAVDFLVQSTGKPFTSANTITRILNKIFKRKLGVSMLRHIYLTDKYGASSQELKEDAADMGTSVSTIQNQYIKEPSSDQVDN